MAKEILQIWTDGACQRSAQGLSFGWAFLVTGHGINELRAGHGVQERFRRYWSVAAEIRAVEEAIHWAQERKVECVVLHIDFKNLELWATGQWQRKNELTQTYYDFITTCGIDVLWRKTKAHAGDRNNHLVDKAARVASRKDPPSWKGVERGIR